MLWSLVVFLLVALVVGVGIGWVVLKGRRDEPLPDHDLSAPRRSMLSPGAKDVAFPAPGQVNDDVQSSHQTVEYRLSELEKLKGEGQLTQEEYETRKRDLTSD